MIDFSLSFGKEKYCFCPMTKRAYLFSLNNLDLNEDQWIGSNFYVDVDLVNDVKKSLKDEGFVFEDV